MPRYFNERIFFMGKCKYDNSFKSEVIEKGVLKDVISKKKQLYYDSKKLVLNDDIGVIETHYNSSNWNDYFYDNIKNPLFDCSIRLMESKKKKFHRAKDKIENIVTSYEKPVFVTLTFRDDVLSSTSQETRRRYIARFLKEHCKDYVANIDFSPTKNREHYHAVIGERIDFSKWSYGYVFTEIIRVQDHDIKRVSNYIVKLTAHAFKVNSSLRLIYSRDSL